jgi:Putative transposase
MAKPSLQACSDNIRQCLQEKNDCRRRLEGPDRYQVMTLATHEFIRRFLMHVLPAGFHRIRYYGLLASGKRAENIARARELLMPPIIPVDAIKAISPNAANDKSLPLLRRPHGHH